MDKSVILSACRTPIGRFQGSLSSIPATDLGATAVAAAIDRSGVIPGQIDETIMGMVLPAGVGQAPARQAALRAGLPPSVAALTINKVCGSGLKAVMLASQAIRCGDASVVVAGGMESMSRAPWLVSRQLRGLGNQELIDSMTHDGLRCAMNRQAMGDFADNLARNQSISREDQDAFACESHRKAIISQREHLFDAEIVGQTVKVKGQDSTVTADEGPRADCQPSSVARLAPAFNADGTVTAGNAAMISDGAAALVIASDRFAQTHGLQPVAEVVAYATAGLEPEDLFVAPIDAVKKTLAKTNYSVQDIDLWEINEAFAVQMLACQRGLGIASERLNIRGGAIALGHPIGASGARVLTTLVHALQREDRELGVAALCLGGGNAVAMLIRHLRA